MSSVVVFVFLLDNLAGFNNALNETLISSRYLQSNVTPTIQNCDPIASDQILRAVSQDLELDIIPTYRNDLYQLNNNQFREQSPEDIYNAVLDNSLHEAENVNEETFDKQLNIFDKDFHPFYKGNYVSGVHETAKNLDEKVKNETKVEFPKSVPFLVAIFETLSNVTAQTCAGTLLSPRWVLTAANCVNILSNYYANKTNITDSSHYTIVAGSTNPLLDGSVHNVTTVLLHPALNSSRPANKSTDMDGPYLALMKIEPEMEGATIELIGEEVNNGDVAVYGWILTKNGSEHYSMNRTSLSALILSPVECQAMYSYMDEDVMCLINNDMDKNITQLSSGGPVLMVHDKQLKMLAVVQTDEHLLVAYPLTKHLSWINNVINNK